MTDADLNEQGEKDILQRGVLARAPWQKPKLAVLNVIEAKFGGSPGFDGCISLS